MAKSLKDKVTDALDEAVAGKVAHLELEDVSGDKVQGLLLSDAFAGQSASERQNRIWKYLDAHLSSFERTRIVFIVTDTPGEYAELKKAAG